MSDLLQEAGESVERRGFLDGDQAEPFHDPILFAQAARMMEECGEFMRSLRQPGGPSLSELADVAIVLAAIARHKRWDLYAAIRAKCLADEMTRGYRHNGNGNGAGGALTNGTYKPTTVSGDGGRRRCRCVGNGKDLSPGEPC